LALVRERMRENTHVWIRVRGASMSPAMPPGSVVRLSPLGAEGARPDEVVLAELPSGLPVVHRVVAVNGEQVTLRGDALPRRDPFVRHEAILARVTAVRVGDEERGVLRAPRWRRVRWWRGVLARWWRARSLRP